MKRIFLLLLFFVFLLGCGYGQPNFSNTESEPAEKDTVISLGKPFDGYYSSRIAKSPWDMTIFQGKLFVGSGDYDQNVGECKIACYDLSSNALQISTVPDEEINSFAVINGQLTAPGIDPTDDWSLGNYYVYNDADWETVRNIPNAIHNFSMIEYNGMIFTGLGIAEGNSPAAVSNDSGNTFTQINFYKNGALCAVTDSKKDRIYDLFVLNDRLFAVKTADNFEIFLYNEEKFEYFDSWLYKTPFAEAQFLRDLQKRGGFLSSATYKKAFYFTTGYLCKTCDGKHIEYIPLDDNQYAVDLYCDNDILYVLGVCQCEDGSFLSSIYTVQNSESRCLFEIRNQTFPISLAVSGSDFYLGFGYTVYDPEMSGTVIKYTYKGEQK